MDQLFSAITPAHLAIAFGITLLAGLVKGATGFAMPMIMISGLSMFLPPDIALAMLILPTFVSNTWQAMRQGWREAWGSIRRFRIFLICLTVALYISAHLVRVLSQEALFLLIGLPVAAFTLMQIAGWKPKFRLRLWVEAVIGGFAGFVGGVSGVWGPPTVAYLSAIDTPKTDHLRVQGVIYALGAFVLLGAHIQSGVLRAESLPLSALMVLPAGLGMVVGLAIHDRLDQATFRKVTQFVLLIAALNLVRRALF